MFHGDQLPIAHDPQEYQERYDFVDPGLPLRQTIPGIPTDDIRHSLLLSRQQRAQIKVIAGIRNSARLHHLITEEPTDHVSGQQTDLL